MRPNRDASGASNYNVEVTLSPGLPPSLGVLNEAGTEVVLSSSHGGVQKMRLLSQEEMAAVRERREHKDAPSCPQVKAADPSKVPSINDVRDCLAILDPPWPCYLSTAHCLHSGQQTQCRRHL